MDTATLQISLKTELVDESFSHGMVENALLMMLLDEDRFSYCIMDQSRQKMVVLKDFRLLNKSTADLPSGFLSQLMEQDAVISEIKPSKTIFSVHSNGCVLIPSPLFSKENANEVLNLACRVNPDAVVFDDKIKLSNAHLIYAVSGNLLDEIQFKFKQAEIFNAGTAFIESQLMLNKHQQEYYASVNVRNSNFDLLISNGSELIFYNTFRYETSEDFIYYILFTLEQLQMNPDVIPVRFYGSIDKTSASWMVCKKYIRNVEFGTAAEGIDFSYGFESITPHHYFVLFSQHLCVS